MSHRILLLNGPNLNLLGTRQPEIYGSTTLSDVEKAVGEHAATRGFEITAVQHNGEGEMIDAIHDAAQWAVGIILNPGAYGHTSIALRDAVDGVALPTVEVHVTNVYAREEFRHRSLTAGACAGVIAGFGLRGYTLAVDALLHVLDS